MKAIVGLVSMLVSLSGIAFPESSSQKWIVDPNAGVGGITSGSSKDDLAKIFGAENVESYEVPVGEGMTVEGTRIFGGTKNEVLIEWKQSGAPERITISMPETDWRTKDGITVGTSLDEVEKVNGCPFKLTGFEWDYPGRTVSWEEGKLPGALQLEFDYSNTLSLEEEMQVMGDRDLSSDHPVMKKKGLKVRTLFVRW